jgi:hypothetical protein
MSIPSHDFEAGIKEDDLGSHFAMRDYHILSMDSIGGKVTDNGIALDIKDVPWAGRQMWAPDAAFKDGTYYLYFPVKDKTDVFRIGVAAQVKIPLALLKRRKNPSKEVIVLILLCSKMQMEVTICISAVSGAGNYKMGQQQIQCNRPAENAKEEAILPRVAKLSADMKSFAEAPRNNKIVDAKENYFWKQTTTNVSLKLHGCINTKANIIFPIQQAIRIISIMQLAQVLTARLFTKGCTEPCRRMDQPSFYC